MGHGAWGMGHGAWGMGHGAWGMGLACRAMRVDQLRRLASAARMRLRRPFSRTPSSTRSSSLRSTATSRSISFSRKAGISRPSRQWRSQSSASTQSYL
jgi:hypothetical protein